MSQSAVVNGTTYTLPDNLDQNWGQNVTNWMIAVTNGMLQKAGGTFTLTAEADFGSNFGLKSLYYKSRATNPASAGQVRLGSTESIKWRNNANNADLALATTAGDVLQFNSITLLDVSSSQTLTNKTISAGIFTGQSTFAVGSAVAPSIIYSGDATTGSYAESGGIKFSVSGSNIFSIFSSGLVWSGVASGTGYASSAANPASAGVIRLANTDLVKWRNSGNSGDIAMGPGSTNSLLSYAGVDLVNISASQTLTNKTLSGNTAVTLISGSGTLTLNTSGTVTLPNATDTLIGKATTDTLTNKTLSGNTAVTLISGSGTLTLNTSGTVTLPNATDTLVGKATTDTLTNKTLSGNTAVTLISGSGTLTLNTSGTATIPSATDTLVGKATTDTLTNKTISGSSNTLSNIADGSLTTSYVKADGSRALSATWDAAQIIKFKGVTDASSASAGYIGEVITAFSGGGASPAFTTAAATTTYNDCASTTLTAGNWDIWAAGEVRLNTATGFTAMSFGISTTSGNSSSGLVSGQSVFGLAAFPTANVDSQFHVSPIPVTVSTSTTYYLKQNYTYTGGLPEARATIWARRRS